MTTTTTPRTVPAATWQTIAAKADRLAQSGAVRTLDGTDGAYAVDGDHGAYLTREDRCSCPGWRWRGVCSHVTAVRLAAATADPYRDGDPFAGLDV